MKKRIWPEISLTPRWGNPANIVRACAGAPVSVRALAESALADYLMSTEGFIDNNPAQPVFGEEVHALMRLAMTDQRRRGVGA